MPGVHQLLGTPLSAGTVIDFAGFTIPAGWLECNGASLLRASYPALLAAIAGVQTCTFANADATVVVADSSLLYSGEPVEASRLPAGTVVASITDATHIEVSRNATSAGAADATFFPHGKADTTHFTLPDAKNRVTVGNDSVGEDSTRTTRRVLGEAGGNEVHLLESTEVPEIIYEELFESGTTVFAADNQTGTAAYPHNNMQPYLVVRKIIKT